MIIFIDDGGAAAPPFPVIEEITQTSFGTATTAHNANYPATVNSGDLLLYMVSARVASGNVDVTTPSGLTLLEQRDSGGSSTTPVSFYSRTADGTESGGTVNFVTSVSAFMAVQIWRIQAGTYGAVEFSWNTTIGLTEVNTPNLILSSTSSGLVIPWFGSNGAAAPTTWPYTDNQTNTASGGTSSARVNSCSSTFTSLATIDPPNFIMAVSTNSTVFTVAVRSA